MGTGLLSSTADVVLMACVGPPTGKTAFLTRQVAPWPVAVLVPVPGFVVDATAGAVVTPLAFEDIAADASAAKAAEVLA